MRPAVEGGVAAVHADEGGQVFHGRVFQHRLGQGLRWRPVMALKEVSWGASVMAWMRPVSCTGKKPLGITT
jgi:hypothetical protein